MKKILSIVLVAIMVVAMFAGCATSKGLAKDAVLEIIGEGVSIRLDAAAMQALKQKEITCKNVDSKGEETEVKVSGFSLGDLLAENDISLSDVAAVNFVASDGYVMSAPNAEFIGTDIYILLNYDGEVLEYPRSAIPDKRAMYWVRDLSKIELTIGEVVAETSTVKEIEFFREGITQLKSVELNNQGYNVDSYSLKEFFEKQIGSLPTDPLTMIARDGFKKTETADVFFGNYVTLEAESDEEEQDLPLYFSETISDGMRVKQLEYVISGANAIYFGAEISVPDLFAATGMGQAEKYMFVASDGYETEIPADAIQYGEIFLDEEEDFVRASFEGYDWGTEKGGGKVKYLACIKAVGEGAAAGGASDNAGAGEATADTLLKCFVGDKKTMLTEADFLALPQIEKEISRTNSKGETVKGVYKGVHWNDIAMSLNIDPKTDVVLVSSDGYEVELDSEILIDKGSMFALYQDGEYIASEGDGRVWFCASENFTANNWAKFVVKIVID